MPHSRLVNLFLLLLAFCFVNVQSSNGNTNGFQVQFYDSDTKYAVAITSAVHTNETHARFLITAPVSYGWAAIGSGCMMDGSAMLIVYPNQAGDGVTLSVRTTSAHNTPKPLAPGMLNATLLSSTIKDGQMSAIVEWMGDAKGVLYGSVSITDPAQPFIWAVGPNQKISSNDTNFGIQQHSSYGVMFANMLDSQNMEIIDPVILGVTNYGIRPQPASYHYLIAAHAALLVGAFFIVFPAAVVGLRLNLENSFRIHWMSQVVASVCALIGLGVAIFASIYGIRYSSLTQPHQIIGMGLCLLVAVQVWFGRAHHLRYVLHQKRTWFTHVHLYLGRWVIYWGMVNASLGLALAGLYLYAIGAGVLAILVIILIEVMSFRHNRRRRRQQVPDVEPLVLRGYTRAVSKDGTFGEERPLTEREVDMEYSRS